MEYKIVCVSSISTTHLVPNSISVLKKKTDGNPLQLVKGKMIVRFSIKSKANIPRRLNGLTRTATLTLELMAVWSPYFKSKRRLYKQICQCFDPISQSLFQRMAIIRILMENSSFVDCFPLRIRYTRRHILSLLIHRASGNCRDKAIGFPHSLYGSLPIRENGAKIWDVIIWKGTNHHENKYCL